MPQTFDLLLRGGTVVNHDGIGVRDIGVQDGRIAALGDLSSADAGEIIDAAGLTILPGVIDSQVHFREPGAEHKEDLETGSLAAVMGGVTAVFEMPNTNPLTTSAAALRDKLDRARGRMHCDHAFWVGGTADNADDIPALERLPGAAGIKVFMGSSTGSLLVPDDAGVRAILQKTRRRAAFHAEDEFRLRDRLGERRAGDPSSHPVWRDAEAALSSTRRLVSIARETGALDPCAACLDGGRDALPRRPQGHRFGRGDAASPDLLGRRLSAPRHAPADEPAGPRRVASRRRLGRRRRRHRRHPRLRPCAAHARREGEALSGLALRHARRADAGAGHARPRRRAAACRFCASWT